MLYRRSLLMILGISLMALLSGPIIHRAGAQDPVQPPPPKPASPQDKERDKRGAQRQGAQAEDQNLDKEGTIKLDTDLVLLDVSVVDQNNVSVFNLKKDDFSIFEDKIKQNIEDV